MSVYKNGLRGRSNGLNYATWRDEYIRRFFHDAKTIRRDNLLNFTRVRDKACHRQIRPSRSIACAIRRRLCAEHTPDIFHGPKIAARVRRPLRSTENNFLIRENGLKSADEIEFVVPLARLNRGTFSFLSRTRNICLIFCYVVIL